MFIRVDSLVEVVDGNQKGKHGRVDRIVIEDATGLALVMVSIYSNEDSAFYSIPFNARELRLKKSNAGHLAQLLAMEQTAGERRAA